MDNNKESFVFRTHFKKQLELLSGNQCQNVVLALCDYVEQCQMPCFEDKIEEIIFAGFKVLLDRDREKWDISRKKRQEAGSKGGKAKNSP